MKDKSKILNIFIIILAIALIVLLVVKGGDKEDKDVENMEGDTSALEENTDLTNSESFDVPIPSEDSWTTQTGVVLDEEATEGNLTFSVPDDYFVSYPVIGGCSDVVSISTSTPSDPTVPIALIYKDGCVQNDGVINTYTQRQVKDGYVFQTNSTNTNVLGIFSKIVESASAQ